MATYEDVHAGDVVLGYDGEAWGVRHIQHTPALAVTLVRHGHEVTGCPPAGTPVTLITQASVQDEARVVQTFLDQGFPVELISETWEG